MERMRKWFFTISSDLRPFPYTSIIGSIEDTDYTAGDRYVPIYGRRNTKHFPAIHSLDVRYSWKKNFSWGYVSFYVEILNVYNHKPEDELKWDYRFPYGPNNPKVFSSAEEEDKMLSGILPNFGAEIKF